METIGNSVLKMACLQVAPGAEFSVADALNAACQTRYSRHLTLKGFGYYDVFLIYESPNFEPYLTDEGPIDSILNSHVFNCFPYLGCSHESMFSSLEKATFVGVSLLKLHPLASKSMHDIEAMLMSYLNKIVPERWFALGTLGWNEIVLFIHSEEFQDVAKTLLSLNYDKENLHGSSGSLLKTFSTLGINHNKLPNPSLDQFKSVEAIEQKLSQFEGFKKDIGEEIIPSIGIAAEPAFYPIIKYYWHEKGFNPTDTLGLYDITLKAAGNMTWAGFLARLLHFRYNFRNRIHATFTTIRLAGNKVTNMPSDTPEAQKKDPPKEALSNFDANFFSMSPVSVPFDMIASTDAFGEINSRKLAKHIFSLNAALRNPIYSDVFWDMANYPTYLIKAAQHLKKWIPYKEETPEELFLNASYCISRGAAMRHYGIHGLQQGLSDDLSFIGGGVQRAILALEYIPTHVFKRIKSKWYGFLIAEDPKFAHYNEIIVVPFNNLWQPQTWWQIYHEIGHCIESRLQWLRDREPNPNPTVVQFLRDMPEIERNQYRSLLGELHAEVFGFVLGFFGDLDFFISSLWTLLKRLRSLPRRLDSLDKYIIRSFFVEMFYRRFQAEQQDPAEVYTDLNKAREQLLSHMYKIENTGFTLGTKAHKKYFASYHAPTISRLHEIAADLHKKMRELELRKKFCFAPQKDESSDLPVTEIIEGRVWPYGVQHPEYLLYRLLKKGDKLDFPSQIATILTFWNASIQHLKQEFEQQRQTLNA